MGLKDLFSKKPTVNENGEQVVEVTVDGGYKPETVKLKQGVPAKLVFKRVSDKGCLEQVHSNDLDFNEDLPLNEAVTVPVNTSKAGEYGFACGMDMFHGKVVVK